jgi:hypothetical protein
MFTLGWEDPRFPILMLMPILAVWIWQLAQSRSGPAAAPRSRPVRVAVAVFMLGYLIFVRADDTQKFIYFNFLERHEREPGPADRIASREPDAARVARVILLITGSLCAVIPMIPFRPRTPIVDRDYRIPYAMSIQYDLYRRFTDALRAQFPTMLVGDSVVWGQFADRDETLLASTSTT